jgi:hypothetical protein
MLPNQTSAETSKQARIFAGKEPYFMVCPACYNSSFRLSRYRSADIFPLLTLRFPIRCRMCAHRMHAGPFTAFQLWQKRKHKHSLVTK